MATSAQVCTYVVERASLSEELTCLRGAIRANATQLLALTATEELDLDPRPEPLSPVRGATASDATPLQLPLTPREIEVLRLMAAGATGTEIARRLVISPGRAKPTCGTSCANLAQAPELKL